MKVFQGKLMQYILKNAVRTVQYRSFTNVLSGPFNYVDGSKVTPVDFEDNIVVIQPSTGKRLCCVPASGSKDVNHAVLAAKLAFKEWSRQSNTQRGRLLLSAGKKIRDNLEYISQVEVNNNGKPIWEARVDIASCADAFEYFGGIIGSLTGQHVPFQGNSFAIVSREPLGVVGGIGAWNFPLQTCSWKVAPALACGNTMVFKPSPLTPLTAIILAELLEEVGFPKGAFNVIQGGAATGNALCSHPSVAKVSFTGSVDTGVKVMKAAADGIKKVTLELGGKSPIIIFDDADMENSVKATLMGNFLSQGAVCSNGTRVFVHEKIASSFLDCLIEATKKLKIGDPFKEDTTVGATISNDHARKVLRYIENAKKSGAVVAYGGEIVTLPPPLNEEEEVIERANNTKFGLAGAVFTRDIQRAMRVIRQLEAGTIWINNYNIYPPEVPFGGYKFSGLGRENGTAVLEHYTQQKTVYMEAGNVDCGPLYQK
ncbi:hypothetical protein R5R35_006444 [Gryllus longicercus]|uniref:Aldehyde dehydrogenase domain-containing protein n=1 Tax=Gryllus longicercus TaxID=2509291 RepID=A0AAN9W1B1_9ORTH